MMMMFDTLALLWQLFFSILQKSILQGKLFYARSVYKLKSIPFLATLYILSKIIYSTVRIQILF